MAAAATHTFIQQHATSHEDQRQRPVTCDAHPAVARQVHVVILLDGGCHSSDDQSAAIMAAQGGGSVQWGLFLEGIGEAGCEVLGDSAAHVVEFLLHLGGWLC